MSVEGVPRWYVMVDVDDGSPAALKVFDHNTVGDVEGSPRSSASRKCECE